MDTQYIAIQTLSSPSPPKHWKVCQWNTFTRLYLRSVGKIRVTIQYSFPREVWFILIVQSQPLFVRPSWHSQNAHMPQMPPSSLFLQFCVCLLSKGLFLPSFLSPNAQTSVGGDWLASTWCPATEYCGNIRFICVPCTLWLNLEYLANIS